MSRTAVEMIELLVESRNAAKATRMDMLKLVNTMNSEKAGKSAKKLDLSNTLEIKRIDAMISSLEHCIVRTMTFEQERTEEGRLAVEAQRKIEYIEYVWGPDKLYASEKPAFMEKAMTVRAEYLGQMLALDDREKDYYWKYATIFVKFKMAASFRDYMRYCREVSHKAEWEAFHAKWIADHSTESSSSNSSKSG
jgi:hypothetical protein